MNITEMTHRKYRKLLRETRDARGNYLFWLIIVFGQLCAVSVIQSTDTVPIDWIQTVGFMVLAIMLLCIGWWYVQADNRILLLKELMVEEIGLREELARLEALEALEEARV